MFQHFKLGQVRRGEAEGGLQPTWPRPELHEKFKQEETWAEGD